MRIFLLRHGIAADVSPGGPRTDEERPLTSEGREVLRTACIGNKVCSGLISAFELTIHKEK